MKRNGSFSDSCLLAAERIQYWFGRDKDYLFPHLFSKFSCKDLFNMHKCDLVKIPKIPSQVNQLPLYGMQMHFQKQHSQKFNLASKEKIDLKQLYQNLLSGISKSALQAHCCANQKKPLLFIEEGDLDSARVMTWRFKGYFVASRKLRFYGRRSSIQPKKHDFVSLQTPKEEKSKSENLEFWEEMMRNKEKQIFHDLSTVHLS